MHFCFRIAEGKIGIKNIKNMENEEITSQYKVDGNKINDMKGSWTRSGEWNKFYGEYETDAGLIRWRRDRSKTLSHIWGRPGN